jgi:hypothetical protein
MRFTEKLRMCWDDLFYPPLVERLEEDLLRVRQDFEARIQEYQNIVAELRAEKALLFAKIAMYELNINRRVGIDPAAKAPQMPNFKDFNSPPPMTRWQQQVALNDAQNAKELAEEAAKQTVKGA